jgi:hypothetical protein
MCRRALLIICLLGAACSLGLWASTCRWVAWYRAEAWQVSAHSGGVEYRDWNLWNPGVRPRTPGQTESRSSFAFTQDILVRQDMDLIDPPYVARGTRWTPIVEIEVPRGRRKAPGTRLFLPLWIPALLCIAPPLLWASHAAWSAVRGRRRRRHGRCPTCDYDLRGSGAQCPECGCTVAPSSDGLRSQVT